MKKHLYVLFGFMLLMIGSWLIVALTGKSHSLYDLSDLQKFYLYFDFIIIMFAAFIYITQHKYF